MRVGCVPARALQEALEKQHLLTFFFFFAQTIWLNCNEQTPFSKAESVRAVCVCVCLKVVVNGLGGAGGDQDTENTELMAIYTRENQSADKVEKCADSHRGPNCRHRHTDHGGRYWKL